MSSTTRSICATLMHALASCHERTHARRRRISRSTRFRSRRHAPPQTIRGRPVTPAANGAPQTPQVDGRISAWIRVRNGVVSRRICVIPAKTQAIPLKSRLEGPKPVEAKITAVSGWPLPPSGDLLPRWGLLIAVLGPHDWPWLRCIERRLLAGCPARRTVPKRPGVERCDRPPSLAPLGRPARRAHTEAAR
jgi:hypothetical protein